METPVNSYRSAFNHLVRSPEAYKLFCYCSRQIIVKDVLSDIFEAYGHIKREAWEVANHHHLRHAVSVCTSILSAQEGGYYSQADEACCRFMLVGMGYANINNK